MNIQNYKIKFNSFFSDLLDFMFPRTCINCKNIIKKDYIGLNLCNICYNQIKEIKPPFCKICGNPFNLRIEYDRICNNCNDSKPHYNVLCGAVEYNEITSALVYAFKYYKKYFLASDMAWVMFNSIQKNIFELDLKNVDCIIPVPLFSRKKRERGFNQSELLAKYFSEISGIPLNNNILYRTLDTVSQSSLDENTRRKNVKNAFRIDIKQSIKNKKILLIDDVSTTGATINECSRVLKKGGCEEVKVVVFARAVKTI
ncbi:ComF family protein [Candidatus Poribacteria bacterium]|nr:ComF family protein [Candidatus Poribacteria bacterium]